MDAGRVKVHTSQLEPEAVGYHNVLRGQTLMQDLEGGRGREEGRGEEGREVEKEEKRGREKGRGEGEKESGI